MLRRLLDDRNFIVLFNFFSMFEKSRKYAKYLCTYLVDLQKVYNRLSNYGEFCNRLALMVGRYMPLRHSMMPTGILWLSKWQAIKRFHVGIELRQVHVLFPLFFIVYMNWIKKCSQVDGCATIGNCKISCLAFAEDLILLPQNLASSAH